MNCSCLRVVITVVICSLVFSLHSAPMTVAGTLDTAFNPLGLTVLSDGSAAKLTGLGYPGALIIDLGGDDEGSPTTAFKFTTQGDRILIAGNSSAGPSGSFGNFAVVALTPTGILDRSFNPSGLTIQADGSATALGYAGSLIIDLGRTDEAESVSAFNFATQGDRIILGGHTNTGPNPFNFALVVLTPTGALDSSFNPSGLTIHSDGSASKITGLGYAGALIIDLGGSDFAYSSNTFDFTTQGDRIILGGLTTTGPANSVLNFALVALTPTGTLDSSFNPSGLTIFPDGSSADLGGYAGSLIVDLGGADFAVSADSFNFTTQGDRIILGGFTTTGPVDSLTNFALIVLTQTGMLDSSFNPSGLTIHSDGSASKVTGLGYAGALIVDLGGSDSGRSVDACTFGAQGDRIILGGATNTGPNPGNFALIVLTQTGVLDSSFNPSGLTIRSDGSAAKLTGLGYPGALIIDLGGSDFGRSIDLFDFSAQGDRIIFAGTTNTGPLGSMGNFALVALTPDGMIDQFFNPAGVSITATGASVDLGGYAGSLIIDLGGNEFDTSVDAFTFTIQGDRIILGGTTTTGPMGSSSNFAVLMIHGSTLFPIPVPVSAFAQLPFVAMAAA